MFRQDDGRTLRTRLKYNVDWDVGSLTFLQLEKLRTRKVMLGQTFQGDLPQSKKSRGTYASVPKIFSISFTEKSQVSVRSTHGLNREKKLTGIASKQFKQREPWCFLQEFRTIHSYSDFSIGELKVLASERYVRLSIPFSSLSCFLKRQVFSHCSSQE